MEDLVKRPGNVLFFNCFEYKTGFQNNLGFRKVFAVEAQPFWLVQRLQYTNEC